jgi:tetratricopeptide (TPR) repeat protein
MPMRSVPHAFLAVACALACALGTAAEPVVGAATVPSSSAETAYRFALAKSLAAEGAIGEAAVELAEVVRRVPDDPFVRLAYAGILSDLASGAPSSRLADDHREEARRQAEAALAIDPNNLEAWRVAAQTRLALAREDPAALAAAVEAFERVAEGDPRDYRSALILGQIHLDSGNADRAAAVLARLAAEVPSHPQIDPLLVRAYLDAGRQAEAEEVLSRMLATDPGRLEIRLDAARLASERGDHQEALEILRQAPPEAAERPALQRREALELYLLGRFDEALERIAGLGAAAGPSVDGLAALVYAAQGRHVEFAAALEGLALDLGVHAELARMLEERGAGPQAEEVLSTLLARLDAGEEPVGAAAGRLALPAAVLVRDDLASLQARLGRPAVAAGTLAPLVDHPEPAVASGARLRSAALLHEGGETAAALALLADGEGGPEADLISLDAHLAAGEERQAARLLRRLGRSEEPRTVLRAAAAAQRHQRFDLALPLVEALVEREAAPQALFQLAALYERSGRIDEAVGTFRRLLAAEPEYDEALNYLGYLWADRGENLDEALEMIRRAVAVEPNNGAYVDSLGWVHHRRGEHELALKYLARAASLLPNDPEVHEHLGDVHRVLGDERRAREHYLRALDLAATENAELRRKVDELAAE